MISNRIGAAGMSRARMSGVSTLAIAAVLSIVGVSAAHACTGYMTIVNNTPADLDVYDVYTENKNGKSWTFNLSWPTGIYLTANETKVRVLNTTRQASRSFRLKVDTNIGNLYAASATCGEGWTITAD
ncbi:MAG: hypothetical protein AAF637_08515 [Pseudomonadota bacterium]